MACELVGSNSCHDGRPTMAAPRHEQQYIAAAPRGCGSPPAQVHLAATAFEGRLFPPKALPPLTEQCAAEEFVTRLITPLAAAHPPLACCTPLARRTAALKQSQQRTDHSRRVGRVSAQRLHMHTRIRMHMHMHMDTTMHTHMHTHTCTRACMLHVTCTGTCACACAHLHRVCAARL